MESMRPVAGKEATQCGGLSGAGGIRTLGPCDRSSVFKTGAFVHSATAPSTVLADPRRPPRGQRTSTPGAAGKCRRGPTLEFMTSSDTPVIPQTRATDVASINDAYAAMAAFEQSIDLDHDLRELIKLRASVLNGCAFCVDMHATDARAAGETERRIAAAAAWRHSPFFTARERAALALTDAITTISNRNEGVPDDVWDEAKANFTKPELGNLVMAITAINAWNRIAVTLLTTPPLD